MDSAWLSVSETVIESSQVESPALVPSQASQASQATPGLAATPALSTLPVPGRLPLGTLLKHLSGAPPECRMQLSLGGHEAREVSGEEKKGVSLDSPAQGLLLPGSLYPAHNPHLQELSRSGDLDSGPFVGGELPGTVQCQGFPRTTDEIICHFRLSCDSPAPQSSLGDILHDSSVGPAPGLPALRRNQTQRAIVCPEASAGTVGSMGSLVFSPRLSVTVVLLGVAVHQAWVPVMERKSISSYCPPTTHTSPLRTPLMRDPGQGWRQQTSSFSLLGGKKNQVKGLWINRKRDSYGSVSTILSTAPYLVWEHPELCSTCEDTDPGCCCGRLGVWGPELGRAGD